MDYEQEEEEEEEDVWRLIRDAILRVLPDVTQEEEEEAVHVALRRAADEVKAEGGGRRGGGRGVDTAVETAVDFVLTAREREGRATTGMTAERSACAMLVGADELPSLRSAGGSAARIKLAELNRRMPGWDPALLELAFRENGLDLRETLSALTDAFGQLPPSAEGEESGLNKSAGTQRDVSSAVPAASGSAASRSHAAVQRRAGSSAHMKASGPGRGRGRGRGGKPSVSASTSSSYSSSSSRAPLLRRVSDVAPRGYQDAMWTRYSGRGKLFDLASAASGRGDGELARQLSRRAHDLGAEAGFERARVVERMSAPFAYREDGEEHHLDLHGLSLEDACTVVRAHIAHAREQLSSMGICSNLVIITGRGTHSAHGRPKLYLGIADELRASGVSFRDDFDSHGALTIAFR